MVLVQSRLFIKISFLGNIGQENVFYGILERKNAFLGYKNRKFKKTDNWHFSKGVNPWFWSKSCSFSNFCFFRQYKLRKCLLWYSRTKKRLSRLKRQEVQKSNNCHFSKGVNPWFWSETGYFSNLLFWAI